MQTSKSLYTKIYYKHMRVAILVSRKLREGLKKQSDLLLHNQLHQLQIE